MANKAPNFYYDSDKILKIWIVVVELPETCCMSIASLKSGNILIFKRISSSII